MNLCKIKNQNGHALISALFIVSLIAIAVTAMSKHLQFNIFRLNTYISADKLALASQAVPFWTQATLKVPKKIFILMGKEGKILKFPATLSKLVPGIHIEGEVYDLQSRLNINNLSEIYYQKIFINLADSVAHIDEQQAKRIIRAVLKKISSKKSEKEPSQPSEMTEGRIKKKKMKADRPFQSLSEFQNLKEVNPKIYQALFPYLCALPEQTPLNFNTISATLMKALIGKEKAGELKNLLQLRGKGIKEPLQFQALLKEMKLADEQLVIESQYFLSIADIKNQERSLRRYSLLKRQLTKKEKVKVFILRESFDAF